MAGVVESLSVELWRNESSNEKAKKQEFGKKKIERKQSKSQEENKRLRVQYKFRWCGWVCFNFIFKFALMDFLCQWLSQKPVKAAVFQGGDQAYLIVFWILMGDCHLNEV